MSIHDHFAYRRGGIVNALDVLENDVIRQAVGGEPAELGYFVVQRQLAAGSVGAEDGDQ